MPFPPRKHEPANYSRNPANIGRREALHHLLLNLQATVALPPLWSRLQALLGVAFPHHSLVLGLQFLDQFPSVVLHSRPLPLRTPDWYKRNHPVHPGFAWLKDHPRAKLVRVSDVLPLDELKRGDYYREFMEPEGWVHSLGLLYWNNEGLEHLIGINRSESQGDFDDDDLELARWLYPQIGVALRRVAALRKASAEQETLSAYLMDLPLPALFVDWSMRVIYHNRAGRETVARWIKGDSKGGFYSATRHLHLPGDIRAACLKLKQKIVAVDRTNTDNTASRTVQIQVSHPIHPGWAASIKSLPFGGDPVIKPGFWITFLEETHDVEPDQHLGRWKLLSLRERDVARRIGRGETNVEIARALGRSLSTVKTHLESMFRKLGVKNRTGLLVKLGRKP